jgi:hypothetical protein
MGVQPAATRAAIPEWPIKGARAHRNGPAPATGVPVEYADMQISAAFRMIEKFAPLLNSVADDATAAYYALDHPESRVELFVEYAATVRRADPVLAQTGFDLFGAGRPLCSTPVRLARLLQDVCARRSLCCSCCR